MHHPEKRMCDTFTQVIQPGDTSFKIKTKAGDEEEYYLTGPWSFNKTTQQPQFEYIRGMPTPILPSRKSPGFYEAAEETKDFQHVLALAVAAEQRKWTRMKPKKDASMIIYVIIAIIVVILMNVYIIMKL
jgi:hypothetical protein